MTDQLPEHVTPRRAAEIMHVSEATILRMIRAGRLNAVRMGRLWRIPYDDLKRGTTEIPIDRTRQ